MDWGYRLFTVLYTKLQNPDILPQYPKISVKIGYFYRFTKTCLPEYKPYNAIH
jgi:hypothetical protein